MTTDDDKVEVQRQRSGALGRFLASQFIREVGETYATQIFLVVLGFANSILVTRLLGPEGRGLFAAANTFAGVGVQLGNLGLHSWNTYRVSREPDSLPVLIGNSLLVGAGCGVAAVGGFVLFRAHPGLAPVSGLLLLLALAAIPLGLLNLLFQNLLIGTQRIHKYNVIDLSTRVCAVLMVGATAPLGVVAPDVVYGLVLVSVVASAAWCLASLVSSIREPLRCSFADLRIGLGYGVRAYFGSLFVFLVLRSDILLVKYLRGAKETGYYAIAVGLADILMMLPTVVGTVLFPRLSAAQSVAAKWALARRVLTIMLPAAPVALAVTLVAARPLIHLAYGSAFDPSVAAVGWLLPGVACLAINTVLMNLFASCGMPPVVVYSPLLALGVNVALNLRLIPTMGFVGAAISSSIAYGLMLAISLAYLRLRLLKGIHV
jgi:O-antigen/teichoic acid export membrane protein